MTQPKFNTHLKTPIAPSNNTGKTAAELQAILDVTTKPRKPAAPSATQLMASVSTSNVDLGDIDTNRLLNRICRPATLDIIDNQRLDINIEFFDSAVKKLKAFRKSSDTIRSKQLAFLGDEDAYDKLVDALETQTRFEAAIPASETLAREQANTVESLQEQVAMLTQQMAAMQPETKIIKGDK